LDESVRMAYLYMNDMFTSVVLILEFKLEMLIYYNIEIVNEYNLILNELTKTS